ncbi:50S ribosomal protein L24 [Candidatus Saccharibacteria bacterium]|nr:50S ribosomal protein L24 [Candidatus Saccharibacteria bacterium]
MQRIKVGDLVKIIAGDNKNVTGKVLKVQNKLGRVVVEGVGTRERHYKKSQFRPQGGKADIQVGVPMSSVALVVEEKSGKTSRVGHKMLGDKKVRVARQHGNKEIK